MAERSQRPVYSLVPGPEVEGIVRQLRLVGAAIGLALAAVAVLAVAAVLVRVFRPVAGSVAAIVLAGVLGMALLGGAIVLLEVTGRRARKAESFGRAASVYRLGCAVAGGMNFLAGCTTVGVIFTSGVSRGLWVPDLLVLALNLLGLVLALPRIKHLRSLHYSPTLPVTRV